MPLTTLDRVAATLTAHRIGHALIGATALAAAGVSRSTFDIDLLVCDPGVLDAALWSTLAAEGVEVDIRRGDADDPLHGVVRIEAKPDRPVDIIVGRLAWQRRALERADRAQADLPIVLPRDLVLLKLYAGGSQDLWDVRELLSLDRTGRLAAEVESDLISLPAAMAQAWDQARRG